MECCDSLLLSSTTPDSPALIHQDEKFGVYRLQWVDRSPGGRGRATYKHIDHDLFLYYVNDEDGWMTGPRPGVGLGGLFSRVRLMRKGYYPHHYFSAQANLFSFGLCRVLAYVLSTVGDSGNIMMVPISSLILMYLFPASQKDILTVIFRHNLKLGS